MNVWGEREEKRGQLTWTLLIEIPNSTCVIVVGALSDSFQTQLLTEAPATAGRLRAIFTRRLLGASWWSTTKQRERSISTGREAFFSALCLTRLKATIRAVATVLVILHTSLSALSFFNSQSLSLSLSLCVCVCVEKWFSLWPSEPMAHLRQGLWKGCTIIYQSLSLSLLTHS